MYYSFYTIFDISITIKPQTMYNTTQKQKDKIADQITVWSLVIISLFISILIF